MAEGGPARAALVFCQQAVNVECDISDTDDATFYARYTCSRLTPQVELRANSIRCGGEAAATTERPAVPTYVRQLRHRCERSVKVLLAWTPFCA